MEFLEKLKEYIDITDKGLDRYLPKEDVYPEILHKAMRYSVFAGGKRIRPVMLLASCEAFGGNVDRAVPFACAMEMIHTYSLIHDDLPAMDNDDYRRGRLTNHKVYGEAMAILAGDGLLSWAFELMAKESVKNPLGVRAMAEIAEGAGINGMVRGQVSDVINENKEIDEDTLKFVHNNKTGAMIKASFAAGAVLGGAGEEDVNKLIAVGENIGLGFQIQDDILDVTGTFETLGKPINSDEKNHKTTFVSVYGLERSGQMAENAFKKAENILKEISGNSDFLIGLTKYISKREC
ncbi:MAG: polyprenyl synthetase family protein [Firmicutes bacterium]|nr:polyprenyl synthetase family protein [Bacillota bacterium]